MIEQLRLIEDQDVRNVEFNSDDWETPDWLARKMASLITWQDKMIFEPFAGTGQIAQYLNEYKHPAAYLYCLEINPERVVKLCDRLGVPRDQLYTGLFWGNVVIHGSDFRTRKVIPQFDVVCTNPPFSMGIEAIARSLKFLNPDNPQARLLYLLPTDYFQSKKRCEAFLALDCHIHHRYPIKGRVAYLRDGKAENGRQIYDSIYDIRPGKLGGTETFIEEE